MKMVDADVGQRYASCLAFCDALYAHDRAAMKPEVVADDTTEIAFVEKQGLERESSEEEGVEAASPSTFASEKEEAQNPHQDSEPVVGSKGLFWGMGAVVVALGAVVLYVSKTM